MCFTYIVCVVSCYVLSIRGYCVCDFLCIIVVLPFVLIIEELSVCCLYVDPCVVLHVCVLFMCTYILVYVCMYVFVFLCRGLVIYYCIVKYYVCMMLHMYVWNMMYDCIMLYICVNCLV